ncbi:MAG: diaminopimelate epimerase [Syntrophomonadaceae bacterium]|nr:diaminopimelate epimerase [Syntrophomonadaceae bacterium]
MNFVKMHGLGNDFIVIEAEWDDIDRFKPLASILCNRHLGIGADGILLTGRSNRADLFMRVINPDGTEAEMCGNGIRCIAKYIYEHGIVKAPTLSILTPAGIRTVDLLVKGNEVQLVRVNMGQPVFELEKIPMVNVDKNCGIIQGLGNIFEITALSMGNPHCVVFVEEIKSVPIDIWGPFLENHQIFPRKTNVEFVQVLNRNQIIMRVWERGAGQTSACGTGACAAVVAAALNGKTQRQVVVHLAYGELLIDWNAQDNHVYMTGPAEEIFRGKIPKQLYNEKLLRRSIVERE